MRCPQDSGRGVGQRCLDVAAGLLGPARDVGKAVRRGIHAVGAGDQERDGFSFHLDLPAAHDERRIGLCGGVARLVEGQVCQLVGERLDALRGLERWDDGNDPVGEVRQPVGAARQRLDDQVVSGFTDLPGQPVPQLDRCFASQQGGRDGLQRRDGLTVGLGDVFSREFVTVA